MKQCRTDCIHAEACRRYADNSTYWQNGDCPIYKPAADVVPKSEVERLKAEKDALIKNYAECMKEFAREIFEEIEEIIIDYQNDGRINRILAEFGMHVVKHEEKTLEQRVAELKKKYTESEDTK